MNRGRPEVPVTTGTGVNGGMRRRRAAYLAGAILLVAACGEAGPRGPEPEDFAGCYTLSRVAVDADGGGGMPGPAGPAGPPGGPMTFELSPVASEELPGYYVLRVPAGEAGAPVAGGAWTLYADSAVIVWQGARRTYAMVVAVDGDTLRGSGKMMRDPHQRSSRVLMVRQSCDDATLVPARSTPAAGPRPQVL
jgi:hypothetical protein